MLLFRSCRSIQLLWRAFRSRRQLCEQRRRRRLLLNVYLHVDESAVARDSIVKIVALYRGYCVRREMLRGLAETSTDAPIPAGPHAAAELDRSSAMATLLQGGFQYRHGAARGDGSAARSRFHSSTTELVQRLSQEYCPVATVLQSFWRMAHAKARYMQRRRDTRTMGVYFAGWTFNARYLRLYRRRCADLAKHQFLVFLARAKEKRRVEELRRAEEARLQLELCHRSCVVIQSYWRGYCTRRDFAEAKREYLAAKAIRDRQEYHQYCAFVIQARWRLYKLSCQWQRVASIRRQLSAVKIQRRWRAILAAVRSVREEYATLTAQTVAAIKIQRCVRAYFGYLRVGHAAAGM